MKTILSLLAIFLIDIASAHALPNLIVNGDFATGVLTPWSAVSGMPSISGGICTLDNAAISQTVVTIPGSRYYLGVDPNLGFSGGVTLTATPTGRGTPDATKSVPLSTGQIRGVLIFTASTASTVIKITGSFAGGFGSAPTVDNISLVLLGPSRFLGKYTGTLVTRLTSSALGLSQRAATRLIANIDSDGRITIFDNAAHIYAGQIFNDGTFDINFNNFLRTTGTAAFGKGIISFKVDGTGLSASDESGAIVNGTISTTVALTRVKP